VFEEVFCRICMARYNSAAEMSEPLDSAIAELASDDLQIRSEAARTVYAAGRELADRAWSSWSSDPELYSLVSGANPHVTVGIAVSPSHFQSIRAANGLPRLADVPPDQDAQEFELQFTEGIALDVLTSTDPNGTGAIARYLRKFSRGIQQVEFLCRDVDRATAILGERFGLTPVYPATRAGADHTRINFFLVNLPEGSKVLIELYEPSTRAGH
jgi:hypothetical protein